MKKQLKSAQWAPAKGAASFLLISSQSYQVFAKPCCGKAPQRPALASDLSRSKVEELCSGTGRVLQKVRRFPAQECCGSAAASPLFLKLPTKMLMENPSSWAPWLLSRAIPKAFLELSADRHTPNNSHVLLPAHNLARQRLNVVNLFIFFKQR